MDASYRTEQTYVDLIKQFILFHNKRHPNDMDETYVSDFLTYLAVKRHVAASTQNQALCAILFLYRHVLNKEIGWVDNGRTWVWKGQNGLWEAFYMVRA